MCNDDEFQEGENRLSAHFLSRELLLSHPNAYNFLTRPAGLQLFLQEQEEEKSVKQNSFML